MLGRGEDTLLPGVLGRAGELEFPGVIRGGVIGLSGDATLVLAGGVDGRGTGPGDAILGFRGLDSRVVGAFRMI